MWLHSASWHDVVTQQICRRLCVALDHQQCLQDIPEKMPYFTFLRRDEIKYKIPRVFPTSCMNTFSYLCMWSLGSTYGSIEVWDSSNNKAKTVYSL